MEKKQPGKKCGNGRLEKVEEGLPVAGYLFRGNR